MILSPTTRVASSSFSSRTLMSAGASRRSMRRLMAALSTRGVGLDGVCMAISWISALSEFSVVRLPSATVRLSHAQSGSIAMTVSGRQDETRDRLADCPRYGGASVSGFLGSLGGGKNSDAGASELIGARTSKSSVEKASVVLRPAQSSIGRALDAVALAGTSTPPRLSRVRMGPTMERVAWT